MKRLFIPIVLVAGGAALVLALTSGGTSKANKTAQTAPGRYGGAAAKQPQGAATSAIDVRTTPLGKILVDAKGRTLYLFEADKPDMSNCSGACLSLWPAFTSAGKPQVHGGALAAKIGTISTAGGKQQVTYGGHPLYYYAADQKPGDTTGQGLKQFGAGWYVLATTGNKIDND